MVLQYQLEASKPRNKDGEPNQAAFLFRQLGANGESRDTSWTKALEPTGKKERMGASGTVALPFAHWLTSWRLVAGERLSEAAREGRPQPVQRLPEGGIVVSDLALGLAGSPIAWQFGNERAMMNVTDEFARSDSIFVFYQVLSRVEHRETRTWLTVTNITDPQLGVRVLQLNFPGRLDAGINVAERVLDISRQKRGRYLIELQVGDMRGGGSSVRSIEYEVR